MRRIAVAILLTLLLFGSAAAHPRTVLDADDSPGPLDLVAARFRHSDGEIRLHARTYEAWSDSTLEGEKSFIAFHFNLDRDKNIERCVVVKLDPPEEEGPTVVTGGIYKDDCTKQVSDHPGNVFRNQPNGITLSLARGRIGRGDLRWRALSSFEEEGHEHCSPPTMGPEPVYGACTDTTRWNRHTT